MPIFRFPWARKYLLVKRLGLAALSIMSSAAVYSRPNVLFIVVDDLRPQLGCYGNSVMVTPNMDKLASEGRRFENAYTQIAVCAASRASFLSGTRPDGTHIYTYFTPLRDGLPDAYTLNQHFKANGYYAASVGKVYHNTGEDGYWTEELSHFYTPTYAKKYAADYKPALENGGNVPDSAYGNGLVLNGAMNLLKKMKDTSFFLAVGFHKPHLPFSAPGEYWAKYNEDSLDLAVNGKSPTGTPAIAFGNWGELRSYSDIPDSGPLSDSLQRRLLHGYYASTTFTDALIGKLLNQLKSLGLDQNTIVVLIGDHGWSLGEHDMWGKHSNFEEAVHVPLIVRSPDILVPGIKSNALVELVDIYPTLAEMCGLPIPPRLEGSSFERLMREPNLPWKQAVFSQWPRSVMGYTVRTLRYRYTLWGTQEELYDYQTDPLGNTNLAKTLPDIAKEMKAILEAGWQASTPPPTSKLLIYRSESGKGTSGMMQDDQVFIDGLGRIFEVDNTYFRHSGTPNYSILKKN